MTHPSIEIVHGSPWAELCHYRHPKKKAVEITGDAGQYVLAIQITQESGSSNDG